MIFPPFNFLIFNIKYIIKNIHRIMNEYFFTKNDYNPHIEDYNESYNRIKEQQALKMLKSTTINEKIILLTKQIKNAEITVRSCISALTEEQRKSSQMKAKYEKAMTLLRNRDFQDIKYNHNITNPHFVNGVSSLGENKELVENVSKNISDPYVKLEEKFSSMKPNRLDKDASPKKHTDYITDLKGNNIPVIYVEEKTNSLNLELLEYKLETLSLLSKLCLSDPPPEPLTNEDYIHDKNVQNNTNRKMNKRSSISQNSTDSSLKNKRVSIASQNSATSDRPARNSVSQSSTSSSRSKRVSISYNRDVDKVKKANEIDDTQKSIINEIVKSQENEDKNKKPKSTNDLNIKKLDLKFTSDCDSLFNKKPTSTSKEKLNNKVITAKRIIKKKNSLDELYENIDTSK